MITIGSLFSGIGGIELGLERTGGFKTVWNCEIDAYASAVLKKHWPEVPNLGDITKVDWDGVERPDMLCGGFPCQDISIAGKGKGIKEGTRSGLWREYARAIRSLRPRIVLIENVPAIAHRGLDIVLADLAEIGYDAEWFTLSAQEVGAWHKRERVFIVAHSNDRGVLGQAGQEERRGRLQAKPDNCGPGSDVSDSDGAGSGAFRTEAYSNRAPKNKRRDRLSQHRTVRCCEVNKQGIWAVEPDVGRTLNGFSDWLDKNIAKFYKSHQRIVAYGNANKINPEETLRVLRSRTGAEADEWTAGGQECISAKEVLFTYLRQLSEASKALDDLPSPSEEIQDGFLRGLRANNKSSRPPHRRKPNEQHEGEHTDSLRLLSQFLALDAEEAWGDFRNENAYTRHFYWESGIARVANGVPSRVDRIKCLGNAVVPQVAEAIGEMILEANL